jgi:hypothetical protein
MKRIVTAAVAAAIVLASSAAFAKTAFISGEGEYVWNPKTSHYPQGAYVTDQTMSIKHDDGKTISVSQDVHLKTGKTIDWNYEGAYDGQPHHGDWITIALKRIKPNAFSNDYVMNDGIKGHEIATITKDHVTIRGASFDDKGGKHPYVEVWDKVK